MNRRRILTTTATSITVYSTSKLIHIYGGSGSDFIITNSVRVVDKPVISIINIVLNG